MAYYLNVDEDTLKTLHNSLKNLADSSQKVYSKTQSRSSLNTTLSVQTLFSKFIILWK